MILVAWTTTYGIMAFTVLLRQPTGGYTTAQYCFRTRMRFPSETLEPTDNMCHRRTSTPNSTPRCTVLYCVLAAVGPSDRRHRPVCRPRSLYLPDPAHGEGFACPASLPTVVPASTRCSCRACEACARWAWSCHLIALVCMIRWTDRLRFLHRKP